MRATNLAGLVDSTASNTINLQFITVTSITSSNATYTGNRLSQASGNLTTGDGIVISTATAPMPYNIYAFGTVSSSATYTLTYNCTSSTVIYALVVGGGSGGVGCGGSGAGGVVMLPVTIATGTNTLAISVGSGGNAMINEPDTNTPGKITTVTGSGMSYNGSGITVTGGGGGSGYQNTGNPDPAIQNGISGGSAGGNSAIGQPAGITTNANYNFANNGGISAFYSGGGGGGAGQYGVNSPGSPVNGANGIQCFLPGVSTFTPSGYSQFSTYYWGGAGGTGYGEPAGNGGRGGRVHCHLQTAVSIYWMEMSIRLEYRRLPLDTRI